MKTYSKPVVKTIDIQVEQLFALSALNGEADPNKPALGNGFRGESNEPWGLGENPFFPHF